jgi:hypothetical protein
MVIYATEFVLWCGVFACGGYYNLTPWVRQKLSKRAQQKREASINDPVEHQIEGESEGASNAVQLHQVPSSTSVFRTPSSIASVSEGLRSVDNARV